MPGSHRTHHRRTSKSNAARLGLAGAVAGAIAVGAIAASVVMLGPHGSDRDRPIVGTAGDAADGGAAPSGVPARIPAGTAAPAGPVLSVTTPDGYRYSMAAVAAGTREPVAGSVRAYADYVLSNTQNRPILLDFPADLFIRRAMVPKTALGRCMPQPGVPGDMCTLPDQAQIVLRLRNSKEPIVNGADTFIPPGASYVVRVTTDLPVKKNAVRDDLRLYVWNVRFTTDRKAIEVAFPPA
jgi:hypothetical protein